MGYEELKTHGKSDFPFELYKLDCTSPKYVMAHHYHAFIEIILVDKGNLCVLLDGRSYSATEKDVIIVNSGVIHSAQPFDCKYRCLVFSLNFLKTGNVYGDRIIEEFINHDKFFNEKITDAIFRKLCQNLFNQMANFKDQPFGMIGLINEWFSQILTNKYYVSGFNDSSKKDEQSIIKLKKALAYIRNNYDKNISIEEVARSTGLSTKYFCSFFKQLTNKTAFVYLNDYRIEQACKKLISSDLSVTQIAFESGFNDLSYFIKTFKERKNLSPGEYRKFYGIK